MLFQKQIASKKEKLVGPFSGSFEYEGLYGASLPYIRLNHDQEIVV